MSKPNKFVYGMPEHESSARIPNTSNKEHDASIELDFPKPGFILHPNRQCPTGGCYEPAIYSKVRSRDSITTRMCEKHRIPGSINLTQYLKNSCLLDMLQYCLSKVDIPRFYPSIRHGVIPTDKSGAFNRYNRVVFLATDVNNITQFESQFKSMAASEKQDIYVIVIDFNLLPEIWSNTPTLGNLFTDIGDLFKEINNRKNPFRKTPNKNTYDVEYYYPGCLAINNHTQSAKDTNAGDSIANTSDSITNTSDSIAIEDLQVQLAIANTKIAELQKTIEDVSYTLNQMQHYIVTRLSETDPHMAYIRDNSEEYQKVDSELTTNESKN